MYEQWKGKGVEFVGLGVLDTEAACRGFVEKHRLTFPNGYDDGGRIAKAYGFRYQPWWAVIGKDGTLLQTGFGPSGEDQLVATIRSLIRR